MREPEQLARRRAGEAAVPAQRLLARERGALVRLHVRPQPVAGERGAHRVEVARERSGVDDERGGRQVGDAHVREDGTMAWSPDNPPGTRPVNPFAAPGVGVHYDRGRPYHHARTLERIVTMVAGAMVGASHLDRGLDVACGTGMSTVALAGHADAVIGVDVSAEMMRSARRAPGVHYLLGRAELLPFRDATFDAATCCSGVHWFDQPRFFAELHRVLRPGQLGRPLRPLLRRGDGRRTRVRRVVARALERYPLPPRNPQVGDPRSMEPAGFEKIGDELFADDIEMTHGELTSYQLTISNFVDATEKGASRAELETWSLESTAPLFDGVATRTVRFLGSITCFRRS